jgi:hypothetical protein
VWFRRPADRIERAGSADLMFAALQRGSVPQQFGAVLVLEPADGFDAEVVTATLADRVRAFPRLRQRLMKVPLGCGRAVWVDDPSFTIARFRTGRPSACECEHFIETGDEAVVDNVGVWNRTTVHVDPDGARVGVGQQRGIQPRPDRWRERVLHPHGGAG